jgi:hypothetical protein
MPLNNEPMTCPLTNRCDGRGIADKYLNKDGQYSRDGHAHEKVFDPAVPTTTSEIAQSISWPTGITISLE